MHKKLIMHRDIKLANIVIDSNMHIKIIDFGLAVQMSSPKQKEKTMCGTPNYIAPEILDSDKNDGYSFEVDLWSVGIIIYALLMGKEPFSCSDQNPSRTYAKIRAGVYSFDGKDITENAKDIIRDLLTNDPTKRLTIN